MLKAITASPIVKKSLLGAAMATSILAGGISANAKTPEHPSTTSVSTNPIPETKADASSVVAMYQNVNTTRIKSTAPYRELDEKYLEMIKNRGGNVAGERNGLSKAYSKFGTYFTVLRSQLITDAYKMSSIVDHAVFEADPLYSMLAPNAIKADISKSSIQGDLHSYIEERLDKEMKLLSQDGKPSAQLILNHLDDIIKNSEMSNAEKQKINSQYNAYVKKMPASKSEMDYAKMVAYKAYLIDNSVFRSKFSEHYPIDKNVEKYFHNELDLKLPPSDVNTVANTTSTTRTTAQNKPATTSRTTPNRTTNSTKLEDSREKDNVLINRYLATRPDKANDIGLTYLFRGTYFASFIFEHIMVYEESFKPCDQEIQNTLGEDDAKYAENGFLGLKYRLGSENGISNLFDKLYKDEYKYIKINPEKMIQEIDKASRSDLSKDEYWKKYQEAVAEFDANIPIQKTPVDYSKMIANRIYQASYLYFLQKYTEKANPEQKEFIIKCAEKHFAKTNPATFY